LAWVLGTPYLIVELGGRVREEQAEVLHASLADRHMAVRREALLPLVRMNDPQGVEKTGTRQKARTP
jgi:hypothetical protein